MRLSGLARAFVLSGALVGGVTAGAWGQNDGLLQWLETHYPVREAAG